MNNSLSTPVVIVANGYFCLLAFISSRNNFKHNSLSQGLIKVAPQPPSYDCVIVRAHFGARLNLEKSLEFF